MLFTVCKGTSKISKHEYMRPFLYRNTFKRIKIVTYMAGKALYVCILCLILLWYYTVSHVVTYNLKGRFLRCNRWPFSL